MPWLVIGFGCAVTDWFAVARAHARLEYFFKPATMAAIIVAAALWLPYSGNPRLAQFFILGFVFSLAGDIFLMVPNPRFFLFGLAAFLCAQIAYILALNPTLPPPAAWWLLAPIGLTGAWLVVSVVRGLHAADHDSLRAPVIIYGIVISAMLFSAWATLFRPDWSRAQCACVVAGATLFFISDAMLSWNRFVKPFAAANLGIIITYQLGQLALALTLMV